MGDPLSQILIALAALGLGATGTVLAAATQIIRRQAKARVKYAQVLTGSETAAHHGADRLIVTVQYHDGSQKVVVDRAAPADTASQEAVESALGHLENA